MGHSKKTKDMKEKTKAEVMILRMRIKMILKYRREFFCPAVARETHQEFRMLRAKLETIYKTA